MSDPIVHHCMLCGLILPDSFVCECGLKHEFVNIPLDQRPEWNDMELVLDESFTGEDHE